MTDSQKSTTAISWNTHAMITRAAVAPVKSPLLIEKVRVTRLENFLSAAEEELTALASRSRDLFGRKTKRPSVTAEIQHDVRTADDFLRAFRLSPYGGVNYVRVLVPEEVSPDSPHSLSRSGPPGGAYLPTCGDDELSASEIIITFSDEPDWGMDQDLFDIESYGFGDPPFGGKTGLSSQAPFHMAFMDDDLLLPKILPRLRQSFMEDRIIEFCDLADLAFDKDFSYWGWRFTAWGMHYLQDITQPYHAHPFPPSVLRMISILITNPSRGGLIRGMGNFLRNRHILCEATVHFLLNDAVKKHIAHPFLEALSEPGGRIEVPMAQLMKESARVAASNARRTDKTLVAMINGPRIECPDYFAGDDLSYPLGRLLSDSAVEKPVLYKEFLELISKCLAQTGKVTRYAVERVLSKRSGGFISTGDTTSR